MDSLPSAEVLGVLLAGIASVITAIGALLRAALRDVAQEVRALRAAVEAQAESMADARRYGAVRDELTREVMARLDRLDEDVRRLRSGLYPAVKARAHGSS